MRAVVLTEPGAPLLPMEVADPIAGPGETIVDVLACGVCHSDLHAAAGDYTTTLPIILGHEVTASHHRLGPVLVYACWGCRQPGCWACDSQQEMICSNATEAGLFRDGGYAERMLIPHESYLIPIGDLDPARTAPLACGGLTAYRAVDHTLENLRSTRRPRALIIGAGGLGQFGLQFLKIRSEAEVVVVDASEEKREFALHLGADFAIAPGEVEGQYTAIIDFVGAEATLQVARDHVARQGIAVLVGLSGGTISFGFGLVPHEARFMSSIWGTRDQLAELVHLAGVHGLHSEIEVLPLESAQIAHDRLRLGDVSGRFVLVP